MANVMKLIFKPFFLVPLAQQTRDQISRQNRLKFLKRAAQHTPRSRLELIF